MSDGSDLDPTAHPASSGPRCRRRNHGFDDLEQIVDLLRVYDERCVGVASSCTMNVQLAECGWMFCGRIAVFGPILQPVSPLGVRLGALLHEQHLRLHREFGSGKGEIACHGGADASAAASGVEELLSSQ